MVSGTYASKMKWVLCTILLPISLPYAIINAMQLVTQKQKKEALQGKVVLITGASSGLGESLAHKFYLAGCKVVLAARRKDELERVRCDLMETHSTVPTHPPVILPLDLSDINSLPEKVDKVLSIFGHIDILLNNGGVSVRADVVSTTVDVDIKVMLVNYFGSVAMTKAVLPSMLKRREGHIVCVSSVQGKFAIPHRSAYSASKHAMQAFCDSLRAEVAEHNVKVTVVSPGYINTRLSINALTGNGQTYGINDVTTSNGASPDQMAGDIMKAVIHYEKDTIIAGFQPHLATWLRFLSPSLYFWVMERRALKLNAENRRQEAAKTQKSSKCE